MPAQGGVRRRLTADTTDAGFPRWSPDGQTILFTEHNESRQAALWSVTEVTNPRRRLLSYCRSDAVDG